MRNKTQWETHLAHYVVIDICIDRYILATQKFQLIDWMAKIKLALNMFFASKKMKEIENEAFQCEIILY